MFQLCACHSDTPQYNSSETFRNVPLLLSHVCLCAVRFDGYIAKLKQPRFPVKGTGAAFLRHFMERAMNAAICALVQVAVGSNLPPPTPVVMPFSTAQATACA